MWLTLLTSKWTWIALAVAALGLTVGVQTYRLHASQARVEAVQTAFDTFKGAVEALGQAQEAKNKEIVAQQERTNRETVRSADARVAGILDRYKRLLNQPVSAGSGPVPAVPDTARPIDDAARDQRLLEVLRAADLQTGQLIELQNWVQTIRR